MQTFKQFFTEVSDEIPANDHPVVLVPGSFKPPHRGHYEMVEQYSNAYPSGSVHVLISVPSPTAKVDQQRYTKDGRIITPEAARDIFELYTNHLSNVHVSMSPFPSPVTAAYEALSSLRPGTTVVLGAS